MLPDFVHFLVELEYRGRMGKKKNLRQLHQEMKTAQIIDEGKYLAKWQFAQEAISLAVSEEERPLLLRHLARVYGIFVFSLLYTAGIISWFFFHPQHYLPVAKWLFHSSWTYWGFMVVLMISLFMFGLAKSIKWRSLLGFFCITGMSMTVTIIAFLYRLDTILQALAVTMVIYIGTACFGLFTKKKLLGWGGPLFGALLALILVGFFQVYYQNSQLNLIVTLLDILLFILYIMYEISDTPASWWSLALDGAMDIYLDFINLFLDILSLFGDDDD